MTLDAKMNVQREKPGASPDELCATLRMPPESSKTAKVSGGQIQNFRKGWAIEIMPVGTRAHWFTRVDFGMADALCGQVATVRWLYGQGNFPRCQRCTTVMSKRIKEGKSV